MAFRRLIVFGDETEKMLETLCGDGDEEVEEDEVEQVVRRGTEEMKRVAE